jgi:hypothetical protein
MSDYVIQAIVVSLTSAREDPGILLLTEATLTEVPDTKPDGAKTPGYGDE